MKPKGVAFIEEWMKAGERLVKAQAEYGGREEAVTAWLINFVQMPLDLSTGQRIDLHWELARFAFDGGVVFTAENMQPGVSPLEYGVASLDLEPVTDQQTAEIQRVLKNAIEEFKSVGKVTFPPIHGSFTVTQNALLRFGGNLAANVYFIAGQLLSRYGNKMRICKRCRRLTLMGRRDKQFCSQNCQILFWKKVQTQQHKSSGRGMAKKGTKR